MNALNIALNKNSLLTITSIGLFLLAIVYVFLNCNYHSIWYDEGFSLHIIKHTYSDIWAITANDVHPPLFYWIIKFLSSIFGDSFVLFHFYSSIPVLLTIALAIFLVPKIWNHKAAIFLILFILLHHSTTYVVSDIRMYAWSAFFTFATFVYGWYYITERRWYALLLVTLCATCAAYTHYYALIAIFFIYIFLIAYSYICHRKSALYIAGSAIVSAILYIPWLSILFEQVSTVTDSYWIEGIELKPMLQILNPFFNHITVGIIFLFAIIAYIIAYRAIGNKTKKLFLPLSLLLLSLMPTIIGVAYSFLFRPVFTERYLYCTTPLFFLGLALLLANLNFKKVFNILIILILFVFMGYKSFEVLKNKRDNNAYKDTVMEKYAAFVEANLNTNSAFIYRDRFHREMPAWTLIYPKHVHLCKDELEDSKIQMLGLVPHTKFNSYSELPSNYKTLYYIDTEGYSLLAEKQDSIQITEYYTISREEQYANCHFFELTAKE